MGRDKYADRKGDGGSAARRAARPAAEELRVVAGGLLGDEVAVLGRLIYRSKNQHKSSLMLRRMEHLRRSIRKGAGRGPVMERAKELYAVGSSSLVRGHFVPISVCVMAVAARIFYLVSRQARGPIDSLFEGS